MNGDFRIGPWLVQPSLNNISQNGTFNRLKPQVMQVLVCLAEHKGEVVPKETILQTVWRDTFVSDDVLKRSISELRRVFEDDARESRIIETIPHSKQALAWLEKGLEQRHGFLVGLKDPVWQPLRSESRFQDIVRLVGLPQ